MMNIDDRDKAGDPDSDPEIDDDGFSQDSVNDNQRQQQTNKDTPNENKN